MKSSLIKYLCSTLALAVTFTSCQKQEQQFVEFLPGLQILNVADRSVSAEITVGDGMENEYYYCSAMSVGQYEAMGGDEALLEWGEQFIPELRNELRKGGQQLEISGLEPDTDYYVYLFGLSREGVAADRVIKQKVRTSAVSYPEFKGSILVDAIKSYMITVEAKTDDASDLFYVTTIRKDEYEAGGKDLAFMQGVFDNVVRSYINLDEGIDKEAVLEGILMTGGSKMGSIMYLDPDTEYVVALMRVEKDGKVSGFLTENTRTAELKQAGGELVFSYDKHYDASYLGFPGMAALPVEISQNGGLGEIIFTSYRDDLTSKTEYPDNLMYSMILGNQSAITNTWYIVYILPWDTDVTIAGFGIGYDEDNARSFSTVTRVKVKLTKEAASDIRDYLVPDETGTATAGRQAVRRTPEFVPAEQ